MTRLSPAVDLSPLVDAASLAPSSHNTQPWLFATTETTVTLYADRLRRLPVNDPDDRELTISCGAAMFNLRVAAAHHGLALSPSPRRGEPDLLAAFEVFSSAPAAADLAPLHPHIAGRRTHHGPFAGPRPLADDLSRRLVEAANAEGATLHLVAGADRAALADLVAEGDQRQFADPAWRHELTHWMHGPHSGDGLVVRQPQRAITKAVVGAFDLGRSTANSDAHLAHDAPLLAVLTTPGDGVADWLVAGQALQRVLLVAEAAGLAAGFLNQPCQVASLRPRLASLLGTAEHPQMVLRIGPVDDGGRPTPRRPVADLVPSAGERPPSRRTFLRRAGLGALRRRVKRLR